MSKYTRLTNFVAKTDSKTEIDEIGLLEHHAGFSLHNILAAPINIYFDRLID